MRKNRHAMTAEGLKETSPRCRPSEAGFTLIELVLLVVVVAILAAVVSLSLSGLSGVRLDNAVNKLVGDLRYAQQRAVTTQSRHGLTIDSALQYSIHEDCGLDGICENADDRALTAGVDTYVKDPINLGQNFIVSFNTYQQGQLAGVLFSSTTPFCGGDTIEFDSIGGPTNTSGTLLACGAMSLTLTYSGNTRTITIQPNTGSLSY